MPDKTHIFKRLPILFAVMLPISLAVFFGISGWTGIYGAESVVPPGNTARLAACESGRSLQAPTLAIADCPDPAAAPESTVPGQAIVVLDSGIDASLAAELLGALGCVSGAVDTSGIAFGCAAVELAPGVSLDQGIAELEQQPFVRMAQPNHVYHLMEDAIPAASAPNAPNLSLSAGICAQSQPQEPNDPQADRTTGRQRAALAAIRAYDAWQIAHTDGAVTIAVLDTGCDMDHPDLQGNLLKDAAYDVIRGTSDVIDTTGHGTHVAGIAAADANNGVGVAGASFNARVLPVCVIDSSGRTNSAYVLRGLSYLEQVRAAHPEYNLRVVNMSFGGKMASPDAGDAAVIRAIDQLSREGVLLVCAAGNTDASHDEIPPYRSWPGDFSDNILQVGNADVSTAGSSELAASSNFNTQGQMTKLICAPGASICSTVPGGSHDGGESDFDTKSGTSMASPCVAGVAALVFAANPQLAPDQVASILCSTAGDMGPAGFDEPTGFGLVDAYAAVQAARNGIWMDGARSVTVGGKATLSPSPSARAAGSLTWSSSQPDVALIDSSGTVTGIAPGYAVISARDSGISLTQVIAVHAAQITGVSDLKVGQSAALSVAESRSAQGAVPASIWLWESENPAVAAIGDSGRVRGVSPGTTLIHASLSSDATVQLAFELNVRPATTDISNAQVDGIDATYAFTGDVIMPRPKVMLGTMLLSAGSDYALSYRNNLGVGTATLTITGIGNYSGTIIRTFKIVSAAAPAPEKDASNEQEAAAPPKKAQNLKAVPIMRAVKYSKVKKKAATTAKAARVTGAKGKVTFAKVDGSKRLSIGKTSGRATVHKGAPRGTYKMRVRVRAAGNARFKPATRTITVKVRVK